MSISTHRGSPVVGGFLMLLLCAAGAHAQDWQRVWADEFNGTAIDRSIWSFGLGPANDCVHYFTDRTENARLEGGRLHVIALAEPYQGYNYTAALLQTSRSVYWRYGRIEARIRLPATRGFVPAFWMMPEDDLYGWWPLSGEIDVMEHPTNQVNQIFGTVHTDAFNSFTGSGPRGGNTRIPDAEAAFHVYAVEWTPESMAFYVDDQKYFVFPNSHTGSAEWPFDQPFHIILSMGVGGGWVGNPDATSVFPAVMEVDYVRVYQDMNDAIICGADFVQDHSQAVPYRVPEVEGAQVTWSVPGGARIVSGQGTRRIEVDWGTLGGDVTAEMVVPGAAYTQALAVAVSPNHLKNGGFEKGVKYWHKTGPFPAQADFARVSEGAHAGNCCLSVDVKTPGAHSWDAQLSQRDIPLAEGKSYQVSLFAKTMDGANTVTLAVINSADYTLYASKALALTSTWKEYHLDFIAPANARASLNVDMGGHTGRYCFDDFALTTPPAALAGQIQNGDFSRGTFAWTFSTLWPAQATSAVTNGEYAVAINHGGVNVWDIYVGQAGMRIEKGKRYVVSFDAYAAAPRQISALVGKNSAPWTVYSGSQIVSLTTAKRKYTYFFTMAHPTDNQARLGFDIGGSSVGVFLDNVTLE